MTRAFVLSGGASLGAIQVGMLHALFERGIAPDLIVGTSAGAINGAFIASREPSVATAEALADVWRGLRRGTIFPTNPVTGLLGFLGRSDYLVPDANLRRLIARHVEVDHLEQMSTPLHVVVTDVLTGEELGLSTGPAVDAVLAESEQAVATYRAGKTQVLGALVGKVMKRMGGKANPAVVNKVLLERIG